MVKHADWLDPLNKLIWQQVFKARLTKMTLRDGRTFTITYRIKDGVEKAWVKAEVGYVPCGWFVVSEVLDPMFTRPSEKTKVS